MSAGDTEFTSSCQATWSASSTQCRRSLNWLPMKQLVNYKLAVTAYMTRSTVDAHRNYEPSRSLFSSDRLLLCAPCLRLDNFKKLLAVMLQWCGTTIYFSTVDRLSHCLILTDFKMYLFSVAYMSSDSSI